jgi:hypothetical protein
MDASDRRTAPDLGAGRTTTTAERERGPVHPAGHSGAGDGDGSAPHAASATDAMKGIGQLIGELREYASYYVGAKVDGFKITFRNIGIYAVLGVVGLIVMSAMVTTAVVLLLVGLALAIGKPFDPDQPWVGAVVVGLLVLGGLAAGVIIGMRKLTNTSRAALVRKYEERQRQQRIHFGRDVRGREADPATEVAGR